MAKIRNRRKLRNILIRPAYQFRLVLIHVLFVFFVVVAIFSGVVVSVKMTAANAENLWFDYVVAEIFLRLFDVVGIAVLLITVVSVVFHIFISHRIFGPMVNMGHTFECISKGDLSRKVFLRRKDFFKPEAQKINYMLAALNGRITALKANQADLKIVSEQMKSKDFRNCLHLIIKANQELLDQWILGEPADENKK